MAKIGDLLYGMRIVKTYNGQLYEERPLFNGFEGIVVWNTWDTGEWQVLRTWREKGEYRTEEIGYIDDDSKIMEPDCKGEEIAEFIKEKVSKICNKNPQIAYKIKEQQVSDELLSAGIIGTRDVPAIHHISKKLFNKIVEWLTQYINQQIDKAMQPIKDQYNSILPIAIDETMANIIQRHDER